MTNKTSKGATKRFARRLVLALIIVITLILGAVTIAYCKGSDRGRDLYEKELQGALISAYDQGYADATKPLIESAQISGFELDGEDFIVYLQFSNGEIHDYHCTAGNVVEALPFPVTR